MMNKTLIAVLVTGILVVVLSAPPSVMGQAVAVPERACGPLDANGRCIFTTEQTNELKALFDSLNPNAANDDAANKAAPDAQQSQVRQASPPTGSAGGLNCDYVVRDRNLYVNNHELIYCAMRGYQVKNSSAPNPPNISQYADGGHFAGCEPEPTLIGNTEYYACAAR